jgi:hypothetical protein
MRMTALVMGVHDYTGARGRHGPEVQVYEEARACMRVPMAHGSTALSHNNNNTKSRTHASAANPHKLRCDVCMYVHSRALSLPRAVWGIDGKLCI